MRPPDTDPLDSESPKAEELPQTIALATAARGARVIRLFERTNMSDVPTRRDFRRVDAAAEYLRPWKRKAGGMHELRRVLARVERRPLLTRLTDHDVIRALAHALVRGSLIAYESDGAFAKAGSIQRTSRVPDDAADTAAPAPAPLAPASPVLALDPLPEVVLPLLEDVQIEGARVLPEVLQTMEQIDLTMEQLSLATVSLAPAPTGIPAVGTAMTAATTDITAELAAL